MNVHILQREVQAELANILDYWMKYTPDEANGGFIGKIDHDNTIYADAPKGAVLNARILWTFSAAYYATQQPRYLQMAGRAFKYIQHYFVDQEYGGVYWTVDAKGQPLNTKKQVYAQAFVLYACSEYYRCCGHPAAKTLAIEFYYLLQEYSYDKEKGGYLEAFTRKWQPIEDARLSAKDANEAKTMNTHLHVLEAYTNLYRIWPEESLAHHIRQLLQNFYDHIINRDTGHLHLFFTETWEVKGDMVSYGHDIEASWLLLEAAEVLHNEELIQTYQEVALHMAQAALEGLDRDGGLWYEYEPGQRHLIKEKHSWPQAEALIGFVNAWQLSKDETYMQQAFATWDFIQQHIMDKQYGEWYWGITEDYSIMKNEDKVGIWKCPYHNSRACLELMRRLTSPPLTPNPQGCCILRRYKFVENKLGEKMEAQKSILYYFDQIADPRRGAGQRHEQTFVLLLVLMSTMSGYYGYRAIGDFIRRNRQDLLQHLQPKKGRLPSFYTVRRILQGIDFSAVTQQFNRWAAQYRTGEGSPWVSIDGKTICGTVTHAQDAQQQFTSLVSLYCADRQVVLGMQQVKHSKDNEITIVQQLIETLGLAGVRFTLDALHCQKKQRPPLSQARVIM